MGTSEKPESATTEKGEGTAAPADEPAASPKLSGKIGGSMDESADFAGKLITRIVLISLASLYVVTVLAVLDHFLFKTRESLAAES
jgi:hypothetical protein